MFEGYLLTNSYSDISNGFNKAWNEPSFAQCKKDTGGDIWVVFATINGIGTSIAYSNTLIDGNTITYRQMRNGVRPFNTVTTNMVTRDGVTQLYVAAMHEYPSSNWSNVTSLVPNIGNFSNINQALVYIKNFIPTPTFDLDVYTQGTSNPLISLVWSNLQNPVEGVDYYITIGLNKALPPQSYDFVSWIDSTSFDSGSITISFEDAREIGVAFPIGQTGDFRVVFKAQLFHYDDRGFRIFDDEKIVNVSNKGEIYGDDVTPHEQTSVENDDNYNEETNTYINPHSGNDESLDNLLTTSYVLTRSELLALKNFLWSADYHDNVYLLNNSPIENIISIKTIPFSVASNTSVTLKIGNVVATGVTGKTTNDTHKFVLPVTTVPKKYNNFLDYYKTSVSVYLPFIGVHDLPTNVVMGKKLRFTYIFDIVTGACAVEIAVGSDTNFSPIDYVMGNCAIDLPISAQNRTQVEIAQQKIRNSGVANAVGGVASTIGNLISGNIGGAISSGATATANAMNNYLDYSTQEYHTTTKGVIGSQLINFIPNECYLIIDRPIYTRPSTYAHDFGYPCELSLTLGNLTGYTQVSHSIELSGIPCTEQEREELRNLLIGGVYL